jgi:SAM-dependent methyltransferase
MRNYSLTLLLLPLLPIGTSAWSNVPQSRKHFWTDLLVLASAAPLPVIASVTDPKTGIALPEIGEIESSIPTQWTENPFSGDTKSIFGRLDSTPDSNFYTEPRFVEHVDENAVRAMTEYISKNAIQDSDAAVLDLCSSWTSHIDTKAKITLVAGLGMNEIELKANPALSEYTVRDLNENPTLPYSDNTFSVVLCQLSIDYLTKPLEVMKEVSRVLKPGGKVHIFFSNRLFIQKAVAVWTGADDIDHAYTVGSYLALCNGEFENIQARDLSTRQGRTKMIVGDPLYVVFATKK